VDAHIDDLHPDEGLVATLMSSAQTPGHAFRLLNDQAVPARDWAKWAAENLARQYRLFHVGGVLLAYDPATDCIGVFIAGCRKDVAGFDPNRRCAEGSLLDKAEAFPVKVGYVTYGEYQLDDETGRANPFGVLAPCGICRREFAAAIKAGRLQATTRISMYNPEGNVWHSNIGDILAIYGTVRTVQ
jgi:hypothetical protein